MPVFQAPPGFFDVSFVWGERAVIRFRVLYRVRSFRGSVYHISRMNSIMQKKSRPQAAFIRFSGSERSSAEFQLHDDLFRAFVVLFLILEFDVPEAELFIKVPCGVVAVDITEADLFVFAVFAQQFDYLLADSKPKPLP